MRSQWSINRLKWTHLSNQRVARCHHVTGKYFAWKNIPPEQKVSCAVLRSVLTRRQRIHLTNIFHVFGNRHRQKWRKTKICWLFYDFKRSESKEAKNQTQSDVPLSRSGFSTNLKCYWDTKEEWQLLFAAVSHKHSSSKEESAMRCRGWWKFRNVIKRNFYDEIFRSLNETWNFHQFFNVKKAENTFSLSVTNWNAWSALFVIILYHRLIKIPFQQNDYESISPPPSFSIKLRTYSDIYFLITTLLVLLVQNAKGPSSSILRQASNYFISCIVSVFCFPNL